MQKNETSDEEQTHTMKRHHSSLSYAIKRERMRYF